MVESGPTHISHPNNQSTLSSCSIYAVGFSLVKVRSRTYYYLIRALTAIRALEECKTLVVEATEYAEDNQRWRDVQRFDEVGEIIDAMWIWSRRLIEPDLPEAQTYTVQKLEAANCFGNPGSYVSMIERVFRSSRGALRAPIDSKLVNRRRAHISTLLKKM